MNFTRSSFVFLAALLIACAPFAGAATCTNASLSGTYGIVSSGLNGSLLPSASVIQATFDGQGNLTATQNKSDDGTILTYTVTGTYTVSSNCTGTVTWTGDGKTDNGNFYLDSVSDGVYDGAVEIQTDADHVQSGTATAQGKATCSDTGVKHTYAFHATGLDLATGQIAIGGTLTLNGKGTISGTETLSIYGLISNSVSVTGTYTISSTCTGTATITPSGLSTMNLTLVVVDAGKQILALETDTNTVVTAMFQE